MSSVAAASQFESFVADFLAQYFAHNPTSGSRLGLHQYDGFLPNLAKETIERHVAELRRFQDRLGTIPANALSLEARLDYEVLEFAIKDDVCRLEERRGWERNPMFYLGYCDVSRYVKRNYAPLETRLGSAIIHMRSIPRVLAAAKANLAKSLAKPFVETAIEQYTGLNKFLSGELRSIPRQSGISLLTGEVDKATKEAVSAISRFIDFLKQERLPHVHQNFAIGSEQYARMLEYGEMVRIPLQKLLEVGLEDLNANRERLERTARKVSRSKTAVEVIRMLGKEHPTAEGLIPEAAAMLSKIRKFLISRDIISIPSEILPIVEASPPFMRTGFAMLSSAGPFEAIANESYYYITPVEADWPDNKKEQWLSRFDYNTLRDVSIHEAFPGHFVHFLHLSRVASRVRRIFRSTAFVEGWAHYCEQMMLDAGFGGNDPKLRTAQLVEALLRDVRYVVSIKMHTQGMTLDEAAKFFMENAYYEELPARKEATRGTYNPEYLAYTLGKLMIMKLRADYVKEHRTRGRRGALREFHDKLLSFGAPPIPLVRRHMLETNANKIL